MKTAIVKLSEIAEHPTMRMDAKYWIDKKIKKVKKVSTKSKNKKK